MGFPFPVLAALASLQGLAIPAGSSASVHMGMGAGMPMLHRHYRGAVHRFAGEAGRLLATPATRAEFVDQAEMWMAESAGCTLASTGQVHDALDSVPRALPHHLMGHHAYATPHGYAALQRWFSRDKAARTPRWQNASHAMACRHTRGAAAAGVSCGAHTAGSCGQCPMGNGAAWCNGDCQWVVQPHAPSGQCMNRDVGQTGGGWISSLLDTVTGILPGSFRVQAPSPRAQRAVGLKDVSAVVECRAAQHRQLAGYHANSSLTVSASAHAAARRHCLQNETLAAEEQMRQDQGLPAGAGGAATNAPANGSHANPRTGGMLLMSGANRNSHGAVQEVIANHQEFAAAHGYSYWWHSGNMAQEEGVRQPYWTKVAMLRRKLRDEPWLDALAWVDDDIVFTNHNVDMLQEALARAEDADVIVTEDPVTHITPLNTGVVIVRNTQRARDLLDELWRRATAVRTDGLTLGGASQVFCLHEQQALAEMKAEGWPGIAVLKQRVQHSPAAVPGSSRGSGFRANGFNLNTFLRWSHYDARREETLWFRDDPEETMWREGDFLGHCSGLAAERRGVCLAMLLSAARRSSASGRGRGGPRRTRASI